MALSIALGVMSIILGLVYTQYGTMTLIEMVRNRRTMGFSHFGAAWIAMAWTCGPHHWLHGIHLLDGRPAGTLEVISVVVGFPAGVIWFLLRVEAFTGGRGDRFIRGTPVWIIALPTIGGIYVTGLIAAILDLPSMGPVDINPIVIANLMLLVLYGAVGYYLARTQIANRRPLGGWSVSGLCLAIVFPTCAVMHGLYAYYTMVGTYSADFSHYLIDVLAVPAAAYFLWVVHALYRGSFQDWNGVPGAAGSFGPPRIDAEGDRDAGATAPARAG
jgi:hypothetical protein